MERISIDTVIDRAKTGRALSPAGIRKAALSMLSSPLNKMVKPCANAFENEWADYFCTWSNFNGPDKTYMQAVRTICLMLNMYNARFTSDLFLCLAGLEKIGSESVTPWLNTCAEDALKEAGMQERFDTWFSGGARAFEVQNGRAPSVKNILTASFDEYGGAGDIGIRKIDLLCGQLNIKEKDEQTEPFKRSGYTMGSGLRDMEMRDVFEKEYTRLFCKWVWMLMMEAPYRIYLRSRSAVKEL